MSRVVIVGGASSHSGKTLVALGLVAALRARGLAVAAAKCGPDYIDPRFLEAASGSPAINLDPWAMSAAEISARAARHAADADLLVIEGVMGLYDGGPGGAGSTASLAAALGAPVVLVVAASGLAQSAAAVAEGFARLAENFSVAGAFVNQVASDRHEALVREGFTRASVPLLGTLRRDPDLAIASRHLGLVQAAEHEDLARKIARAGTRVAEGCDLDAILALVGLGSFGDSPPPCGEGLGEGSDLSLPGEKTRGSVSTRSTRRGAESPLRFPTPGPSPQGGGGLAPLGRRIAVARDVAFAFAYPHMLADWREAGAEIAFFSPLADELPDAAADAVFLPGGYPELHAGTLAAAETFRAGMEDARARGALIYGECGGYMVLGERLIDAGGASHAMLGFLPLVTSFAAPKLHLGYRRLVPLAGLPWRGPLAAHEFHFASVVSAGEGDPLFDAFGADGAPLGPVGQVAAGDVAEHVRRPSHDLSMTNGDNEGIGRFREGDRRGHVLGSFAHVIGRAPPDS